MFSNEKFKFFTKIIVAHVVTYAIVTILAIPQTMNYADIAVELMGIRPLDEISIGAVLIGQIIRGLLLGIVIWWIKDSIIGKKLAWLKLWAILIILGIFNTYGPTHGSIQGLLYLAPIENMPVSMSLGMLEVLAQPLLFSIIVTFQRKGKGEKQRYNS
jgi:fructose-specific phosphotransferase system IIC component